MNEKQHKFQKVNTYKEQKHSCANTLTIAKTIGGGG
jgi:hypothetical protein